MNAIAIPAAREPPRTTRMSSEGFREVLDLCLTTAPLDGRAGGLGLRETAATLRVGGARLERATSCL
jgi:hypothetical protein